MNANTGEASWTNPLQLSGSSEALDGSQQSLDDVRSQWVSYIDENTGNEYWYNTLTGETSKLTEGRGGGGQRARVDIL